MKRPAPERTASARWPKRTVKLSIDRRLLERAQLVHALHRLAVDRGDEVAAPDAGLGRRAARAFHDQALRAAAERLPLLGGERPHREAELAAGCFAARLLAGARGLLGLHLRD